MDIATHKQALRAEARARREAVDAATREQAARRFAETGLTFLRCSDPHSGGPRAIAGYHPIGAEADCRPLMERLALAGHATALPVMDGPDRPLIFRRWAPGEPLVAGGLDIPVPRPDVASVRPDILLVPLLAFDRAGRRLGYGGGFYDRTLAALRAQVPVVAVGIAFSVQEVDKVPHAAYDALMDWVVTERETIETARHDRRSHR